MSQVNGAGVSLSTSITPWNRTPGKPGTGSSNIGSLSSNRWNNSKVTLNLATETTLDASAEEHTEQSVVGGSEAGQMWPPPMFDAARVTDPATGAFTTGVEATSSTNQWSISDFSGTAGSNSLLGEPGSTAAPSCTGWSLQNSSTVSSVPRAITGQQTHSTLVTDSDPSRRYLSGSRTNAWPLNSDSPEFPGDERNNLPLALSKLSVSGAVPSTGCFQPIHDFTDNQLLTCTSKPGDLSTDLTDCQKAKKSSVDSAEVEALFATDPEEAVRSIVNTTEPWGIHPVDQSTPWDTSELNDVSNTATCGSPSVDVANATARGTSGMFDGQTSTVQQPRRIGSLSGSAMGRDLESNVWPSEPPNGTGIWESHYENLGERTARWQPSVGSNINQSGFSSLPGTHAGFVGPSASNPRPQLPPGSESGSSFRGFARPTSGLFPSALSNPSGIGARPVAGAPHAIGTPLHNVSPSTGSNRGFPLVSSPNLVTPNGPWPFPSSATPGENTAPGVGLGNKGRWSNTHFNRLAGKQQQQQHTFPHLLSNPNGAGMRWPPLGNVPQMPGGWPLTDPRRPSLMPGGWSTPPSTETSGYFNPSHPILPPRMCQPGSVASDFPTPIIPPPRNATGVANQQPFRTPHSAFYPALGSGLSPSSSAAQRMFLSPQQHSQQLQQQSVLRANAMRQLVNLGFADEEVQAIFSDINTNVERALMDLRDRTCHPGLDEIIKSFTNSGLMQMGNLEDAVTAEQLSNSRPVNLRSSQHPNTYDQSLPKTNLSAAGLPAENLELSLHVLQQRETQILQTIMQLQSKHQELNGKLKQLRTANVQFATNPVMQELQLQAIQVASQIEAQHAQLKHVRSQAGMIKQITASTNLSHSPSQPLPQQQNTFNSVSSTGAFNILSSGGWPSTNPAAVGGLQRAPQIFDQFTGTDQPLDAGAIPDSGLKIGSGAFLWESSPWSGSAPRASVDPYSNAVDRRWSSSAYPNRPPYGALGDPRWSDVGGSDPGAGVVSSDPQRQFGDSSDEPSGDVRQAASKSWLLVHNIPPHVSVGVLKLAVSSALSKHIKATTGSDSSNGTQPDFELHPHMAARWVLLGFSTTSEAAVVQDCLESSGGEQNSAHYGSVKPIPPGEVLLRLQDIQSLVSRFKGIGVDSTTATGMLRCGAQASSMLSFGSSGTGGIGSGDVAAVVPTGVTTESTDATAHTNDT
ncbi:hypothetical protein T265_00563 [Opisthorchis viverrini]|uniref:UBA domain-containing protein n=1 Tax=Opisthorchis viverrini TaxID=6198 RepID=A0A075A2X2_OPIVI|nr:hypothetical protein T265_00563 [Opisthorchis viverrini]KER33681.1 hypothetical protein T265_00563 [Opisthorchis viverrini]